MSSSKLSIKTKISIGVVLISIAAISVPLIIKLRNTSRLAEIESKLRASGYAVSLAEYREQMPPESENSTVALIGFFKKMGWWQPDSPENVDFKAANTKQNFLANYAVLEDALSKSKNKFPFEEGLEPEHMINLCVRSTMVNLCELAEADVRSKQPDKALARYNLARKLIDRQFSIPAVAGVLEQRLALSMADSLAQDKSLLPGMEKATLLPSHSHSDKDSIQYSLLLSLTMLEDPRATPGLPTVVRSTVSPQVREKLLEFYSEAHERLPDPMDIKANEEFKKWSETYFDSKGMMSDAAGLFGDGNFSWISSIRPEAIRRMMKVRISIEKNFQKSGSYSTTLPNEPDFIDPVSGQPFKVVMKYGKPAVYSFGSNLIDDGGNRGDWVLWFSKDQAKKGAADNKARSSSSADP